MGIDERHALTSQAIKVGRRDPRLRIEIGDISESEVVSKDDNQVWAARQCRTDGT